MPSNMTRVKWLWQHARYYFNVRLRFKVLAWRGCDEALKRRVAVEQVLFDVAAGKRDLLSKQECWDLGLKLGTPKGKTGMWPLYGWFKSGKSGKTKK